MQVCSYLIFLHAYLCAKVPDLRIRGVERALV